MEEESNSPVSFNFAVATLMRLDRILQDMLKISELTSGMTEQRIQLKLLKHFMMNASPLIAQIHGKERAIEYNNEVKRIKIPVRILKNRSYEYYDPNLLDNIFGKAMEIQIELKEHFMPRKMEDDEDEY